MSAPVPPKDDEIEISSEMIEAGMRALGNYDPENWSDEETKAILADVFRAMSRKIRN